MLKIKIRKAKQEDAVDIAKVHVASFIASHEPITQANLTGMVTEKKALTAWRSRLSSSKLITFVGIHNKNIVGFISIELHNKTKQAEIIYLYIDPNHWRKGIGKQLIEYAFKYLTKLSIQSVAIWVLKDNLDSQAFYEAMGGYKTGKERTHLISSSLMLNNIEYFISLKN